MRSGALQTVVRAALVFSFVAGAGLFHTWLRVDGLDQAYRLSDLNRDHERLLLENERLRLEVATLKAPVRIERMARENLGMRTPRPHQVIVVRERAAPPAVHVEARRPPQVFATVEVGHGR